MLLSCLPRWACWWQCSTGTSTWSPRRPAGRSTSSSPGLGPHWNLVEMLLCSSKSFLHRPLPHHPALLEGSLRHAGLVFRVVGFSSLSLNQVLFSEPGLFLSSPSPSPPASSSSSELSRAQPSHLRWRSRFCLWTCGHPFISCWFFSHPCRLSSLESIWTQGTTTSGSKTDDTVMIMMVPNNH